MYFLNIQFKTIAILAVYISFSLLDLAAVSQFDLSFSSGHTQSKKKVNFTAAKSQGVLYMRKKLWRQAQRQFDLAYSTPEGKKDYLTLYYRAYIARQYLQLETAFSMTEAALKIAEPESKSHRDALTLLNEMKAKFGAVILEKGEDNLQDVGRVFLRTPRKIFNKEKRKQFADIQARFNSVDVRLPAKIYLPYGKYTANYVAFSIKKNKKPSKIKIPFISAEKKLKKDNTWLYASIGAGVVVAGIVTYLVLDPGEETPNAVFSFANTSSEAK
jgi:hypothetical protein